MKEVRTHTWRLPDLALDHADAHGGTGVRAHRLDLGDRPGSSVHFVDYVEVAPGGSIGYHRHGQGEEEFYLVLEGHGTMRLDAAELPVCRGDLVRNPPGGEHGLVNSGDKPLQLFVFEVAASQPVEG